jgi:hypothetical protein
MGQGKKILIPMTIRVSINASAKIFITARPKTPELCSGDEARKTLCEKIPRSSAAWIFYNELCH